MATETKINDIASQLSTASRLVVSTDFFWVYTASGLQVKIPAEFAKAYLVNGLKPSIGTDGTWIIGGENTGVKAEGVSPRLMADNEGIKVSYDNGNTYQHLVLYTQMDIGLQELIDTYKEIRDAEVVRVASETSRTKAEEARVAAEQSRVKAEEARVAAETKRENDFRQSKSSADDATNKALSTYSHPPYVDADGYYYKWNVSTGSYDKTDVNLTGKAFQIKKVFSSVSAMNATDVNSFAENDFILINTANVEDEDNAKLYVVATNQQGRKFYSYLVDMSGFRGFTGKTPQIVIGSVNTLVSGSSASASLVANGTDANGNPVYTLNFAIPKGDKITLADLTEDEIKLLQKPANDAIAACNSATGNANAATSAANTAAAKANAAADDATSKSTEAGKLNSKVAADEEARVNAESGRVSAETTRKTNEDARIKAETGRTTAENSRSDAETARADAETKRKSAESSRVTAETARADAETKRKNSESARDTNETSRKNAESDRALAETARVDAETSRVDAEKLRVTAESTRNINENSRKSEEGIRVSAETARKSNEDTRKSQESARVNAESGRVNAEQDRVAAEEDRVAAETQREEDFATSKTACDDATSSSQKQTAACKTATDNANIQASAAQSAASAANTSKANIEKNETARQDAEKTRQTQETARMNAEATRNSNETARKTAESGRATAENTRNSNENTRKSQEAERVNAESSRVNAEDDRIAAEEDRVSAETKRETDFAASKKACDDATAASKTQTAACQTAADNATEQASAAQTAASAANTSKANIEKNETARQEAEKARQSQESTRSVAENTRNSNEMTRKANEEARIKAETAREANAKNAVAAAEEAANNALDTANHPTKVGEDNYVYLWNKEQQIYEKTAIYVKGSKGDKGDKGDQGIQGPQGEKGKSPIIKNGKWWLWDENSNAYTDSGVSVSSDYLLTKGKVEDVLTGDISSHSHSKYALATSLVEETQRATQKEAAIQSVVDIINGSSQVEGSFRKAIADLIGGAPEALDTLKEIADKLADDDTLHDAIQAAITLKADQSALDAAIKRITSLEGGSASTIEVTGTGNAITGISKSGTKITANKGATFLTSHQSLAGYAKTSQIPTKVSQLTNDSGFLTSHQSLAGYATETWVKGLKYITDADAAAKYQPKGNYLTSHQSLADYAKKTDIPVVPTKVSAFVNDANYLTAHQSLEEYAKKTELPTKVSQLTNDANYLTSHQSLEGYVNAVTTTGTGNAVTGITKSGRTVMVTKGANFLTSHQDISGKSDTTHTHSVKINGVTKTIAATGGKPVDLGNYLTTHQSLDGYAKTSQIPTKVSQLANDSGYLTSHQSLEGYAKTSQLPTKTSQLTNDSGFLTSHQSLTGYATESWVKGLKYITDADAAAKYQPRGNYLTSHQSLAAYIKTVDADSKYLGKTEKAASASTADNATKVNNHTVNTDVPSGAKFTDTEYIIPTLDSAPTSSTLTFTDNGATRSFKIGYMCRVADSSAEHGYKFYQLYNISNGKATWGEISGGGDYDETVTVTLTSSVPSSDSNLNGVVVTVKNTTSGDTQTQTWNGTPLVFKIPAVNTYTVSASDSELYIKPNTQSYTAGVGTSRNVTLTYYLNPLGIYILDTDGNLVATEKWDTANNSKAVGVFVGTEYSKFVISPTEISNKEWGPYGTTISGIGTTEDMTTAKMDYAGKTNTDKIIAQLGTGKAPAAESCRNYTFKNGKKGYLWSLGEAQIAYNNKKAIITAMSKIGGTPMLTYGYYWTSTQCSSYSAWMLSFSDGYVDSNYKHYGNFVRPVCSL